MRRHSKLEPVVLAAALACLPPALVAPAVLAAEGEAVTEARRHFHIAPGPLPRALNRLATQAGLALTYEPALAAGKTTPGLQGELTPAEALRRLLAGTGLGFRFTAAGAVTLERGAGRDGTGALRMGPIMVVADQTAYGRVEGYRAALQSVATKTTLPLAITPASVQVVPREVIEDQAAQGLEDLYKNVSGVVQTGSTLNASSEVLPVIRGFESPVLLRDGLRANRDGGGLGVADLVNVDSIQVLKGPASILYGALDPGGVLSYTTKKPQPEPFVTVEQELGSHQHRRTTLDATGPLNAGKTVMYRVAAAYTDAESFRDGVDMERTAFAPSLLFTPDERTDLLLEASYAREETPYDSGVPVGFDGEELVDDDTFFGQQNLDGRELEDTFVTARLEHRFNPAFTVRTQLQYHDTNAANEGLRNRGVAGTPGGETLRRRYQNEKLDEQQYELVTDLNARFETGSVFHELLVGVNLNEFDFEGTSFRQNLPVIPVTDDPPGSFVPPADQSGATRTDFEQEWTAVYLQNQMDLLDDRLHLLVGGRYDDFEQSAAFDGAEQPDVSENEVTWRFGALYELTDWMSPYVSYAESFVPQNSRIRGLTGEILPPEEGVQYEAGLKLSFLERRLAATLAAFHIEKDNVGVFDFPAFLASGVVAFTTEEQRSRGLELDVAGQLTAGLQLIGNYAYTDTKILSNGANPDRVGEELGNVPRHSARLFLQYSLPARMLEGGRVFGGVNYEGDRQAAFDDTELDALVTVDVGARYTGTWAGSDVSFQLNVDNLFDEDYFVRASDQSIVHPGAPRTVMGTLRVSF